MVRRVDHTGLLYPATKTNISTLQNKSIYKTCCESRLITYNCNMKKTDHISTIAELSESEGVFTTAQATRTGILRDALHDAAASGRIEQIAHGAYRLVGSGSEQTDELVAAWKPTASDRFTHERMQAEAWDGVAVGGATAASLLGIGDFYLSPYRIYAPRRINSRNKAVSFAVRKVARDEASFASGLPVTTPERTIFDLVAGDEDLSLVADALRGACAGSRPFDFNKLEALIHGKYGKNKANQILTSLLADAGIAERG